MDDPEKRSLLELLDALCDDRLDAREHDRLQGLLKEDPASQRTYLDYLDTHLALRRLFHAVDPDVSRPAPAPGLLTPGPTVGTLPRFRPRLGPLALGLAASALVALTIALALKGPAGRRPAGPGAGGGSAVAGGKAETEGMPRLAESSGAKFFGGKAVSNGSRLPFGEEFVLVEGLVHLAFADGARAIVRSPAVFEVAGRDRLVMRMGRCSVHAPEGAQGFRVETPVGEVVDLGTRFAVDVSDTGEAEVQVVEGLAEVHPGGRTPGAAAPARLATGQARKYSLDRAVTGQDIPFDRSKYVARLPDRIVSYEADERPQGGVDELRSVSVQRDGVVRTYSVAELIGIDLVHYTSDPSLSASVATGMDEADPERGDLDGRRRAAYLDRDAKLTTGVINPGRSRTPLTSDPVMNDPEDPRAPNTPGFAVRFREPVVNAPGPDVVLFDVQLIIYPERGDPFFASPLRFAPGLRTHLVQDYDINLLSPEARTLAPVRTYRFGGPLRSMGELRAAQHDAGRQTSVRTKALAVGIDLSDLGYKPGEAAEGLFFQSAAPDRLPTAVMDPVFIAGLPPAGRTLARGTTP